MLCSFASTRQSNSPFYEYWNVFKQASHLTCWQMIAGDEPEELCSHSWQPLSLLQLTLSTRSDQTSQAVSVARIDPRSEIQLKLMQAGLISLFFISNHLRSFKKIAGNLDTQIIVHLLLLGWLPEWILAMNWLDSRDVFDSSGMFNKRNPPILLWLYHTLQNSL